MRKTKVFIADDDHGFLSAFTKALDRECPHTTLTTFSSGSELVETLVGLSAYQHPNLIIIDLEMPGISGIEVAQQIRDTPALRALPIILLTGSDKPGDVYQAYQHGVNAFINKPTSFQELKFLASNLCTYWTQIGQLPFQH